MKGATLGRYAGQIAFLGVAASLLAIAALLGAIGWRAYQEVYGQAQRLQSYQALQREAGKADSLSAVYLSVLGEIRRIREALPAQNQGSLVLNMLGEEARHANLALSGINALDEIPFPGYRELPFEINLTGGFTDVVRYLHALETRGMVLQIRKLSAHAEAINKSRVTAKVELSVFAPGAAGVSAPAKETAGAEAGTP